MNSTEQTIPFATMKAVNAEAREIPFTQFLRPDGRHADVRIARPATIADKADAIIAAGFRFECEQLMTGTVSLTISDDDGDHAIEICSNGPAVPVAVDRLITEFRIPTSH